jgi:hypothetical protein
MGGMWKVLVDRWGIVVYEGWVSWHDKQLDFSVYVEVSAAHLQRH